jgi:hypothetical protein
MTYLSIVKAEGGRTPAISRHPSRPSANIDVEHFAANIEIARRDQTTLKKLVRFNHRCIYSTESISKTLQRDGHRCLITGTYEIQSVIDNLVPRAQLEAQPGAIGSVTAAAHIIPFSFISKTERPHDVSYLSF